MILYVFMSMYMTCVVCKRQEWSDRLRLQGHSITKKKDVKEEHFLINILNGFYVAEKF